MAGICGEPSEQPWPLERFIFSFCEFHSGISMSHCAQIKFVAHDPKAEYLLTF